MFIDKYIQFLEKYNVMGLMVSFMISDALKKVVFSIVEDIITPTIEPVIVKYNTEKDYKKIGMIKFKTSNILSNLIYFVVISILMFTSIYLIERK